MTDVDLNIGLTVFKKHVIVLSAPCYIAIRMTSSVLNST